MITSLAPLGATHSIVLILAYTATDVTVTAHLKPKEDGKGEPRHLQFKGTPADVEKKLAEELPQAIQRLVTHQTTLDQLDTELKAEQDKAKKEIEDKKAKAKPAPAAAKKTEPAKPAAKAATKPAKKVTTTHGPAKAGGSAADALAKLQATAAAKPETTQPAADPLAELNALAAAATGGAVEL